MGSRTLRHWREFSTDLSRIPRKFWRLAQQRPQELQMPRGGGPGKVYHSLLIPIACDFLSNVVRKLHFTAEPPRAAARLSLWISCLAAESRVPHMFRNVGELAAVTEGRTDALHKRMSEVRRRAGAKIPKVMACRGYVKSDTWRLAF